MENNRRNFLKRTGLAGISLAGINLMPSFLPDAAAKTEPVAIFQENRNMNESNVSLIGLYGPWATSRMENQLPALSFRRKEYTHLQNWQKAARERVVERMGIPQIPASPEVKVHKQYTFEGLQIEELSWQLPYGRATEAIVLKPANAKGPLPGILAFHDHGGNKYFGTRKITRTPAQQHPMMQAHQRDYYEGRAWANEIAKRGYVVMVADSFTFASRRVMLQDVPQVIRQGLTDLEPEKQENIDRYNKWAAEHEHIMAKSLFSAGTTWPGVFFAEDQKALDILSARPDVDAGRIGCGGLSGGGLRTVMMGGLDARIKCAVCVGFMSTWKDFILHKSYTHTWMTYVPMLPSELDFPEILGLRVPLPTLVLNDADDALFTLPEMKRADGILAEIYRKANAAGNYKGSFYPGPHKFDAAMQAEAFRWFDQWLKS